MGGKHRFRILAVAALAIGVLLALALTAWQRQERDLARLMAMTSKDLPSRVVPGMHWEVRTPVDAGLDPRRLQEFEGYLGGTGFVSRLGYQVYAWGRHTTATDVASAAKPWLTHFLFRAVEEGLLTSLDEHVEDYEPCLLALETSQRGATFRHFATQTAAYQVAEPPGTAFVYNDWQTALFADVLMLKVYAASRWETVDDKVLYPRLGAVLQFEDQPTFIPFGPEDRPGRLAVSPRDFARFGLLYLNEGWWGATQVISAAHARMATSSPLSSSIPRTRGQIAETCPGLRSYGSTATPDDQTYHLTATAGCGG